MSDSILNQPEDNLFVKVRKTDNGDTSITFKDVSLDLPHENQRLVDQFNMTLKQGDRLILTGASGSGKTSIIRAMRGVWRKGEGEITIPAQAKMLCVSQKAFLPRLNLRGMLSCPKKDGFFTDQEVEQALIAAGHEKLAIHLPQNQAKPDYLVKLASSHINNAVKHWNSEFSGLSNERKDAFSACIAKYVEENAQNFFPDHVKPYMTDAVKIDLGQKIAKALNSEMKTNAPLDPGCTNFFYSQTELQPEHKKLASKVAKYLLQGTAMTLASVSDGPKLLRRMSGGEQQKLLFAQALLHKPDILIMDEITAALDKDAGKKLYEQVITALPCSIIISVAHNTHIIDYHTLHAHLENQKITVKEVTPAPDTPAFAPCKRNEQQPKPGM